MTKDEIILLLLTIMGMVLAAELAYILLRKKRRKKEMFKRKSEPVETMADRAHNLILTTESISRTLANQGVNTMEADSLLRKARSDESAKDYSSAIERGEAAKLVLLRAKRGQTSGNQDAPMTANADNRPMNQSIYDSVDVPLSKVQPREEKDLDSLPTNYVQAKFMLNTTKDLLDRKGISSGEAYDYYKKAKKFFDNEDYSSALSNAIKADRLAGSDTVGLIAEEKQESEEIIYVCPSCDSDIADDDVFCRECGENLEDAGCPGCGEPIDTTDKFCRKCGYKQ
ncbi:MAG: zinc ribbon domain-containing protein [Thermoplasmata archaeon]|nr:zinc ribbon domain-containing protein [Thermoplasmata archaeon]MCK5397104.1 zinc ribbon domain-containing protein [Thermoplasmata archaeon]